MRLQQKRFCQLGEQDTERKSESQTESQSAPCDLVNGRTPAVDQRIEDVITINRLSVDVTATTTGDLDDDGNSEVDELCN